MHSTDSLAEKKRMSLFTRMLLKVSFLTVFVFKCGLQLTKMFIFTFPLKNGLKKFSRNFEMELKHWILSTFKLDQSF